MSNIPIDYWICPRGSGYPGMPASETCGNKVSHADFKKACLANLDPTCKCSTKYPDKRPIYLSDFIPVSPLGDYLPC